MKKTISDYGWIMVFYLVILIGIFALNQRYKKIECYHNNNFYQSSYK